MCNTNEFQIILTERSQAQKYILYKSTSLNFMRRDIEENLTGGWKCSIYDMGGSYLGV